MKASKRSSVPSFAPTLFSLVVGPLLLVACGGDAGQAPPEFASDASRSVAADAQDGPRVRADADVPAPVTDSGIEAPSPDFQDAGRKAPHVGLDATGPTPSTVGMPEAGMDAGCRSSAAPINVIWVVDSSGSTLFVEPQLQEMTRALVVEAERRANELRVVVIGRPSSGDAGVPRSDGGAALHIATPVDSKSLFTNLLVLFPDYADHLRSGATTHIVGLTDDNDTLMPADFRARMEQLLGDEFVFHAVASPSVGGLPCIGEEAMANNPICTSAIPAICAAAAVGEHYYELALQTGGEQISICKRDWSPLLERLLEEAGPTSCR